MGKINREKGEKIIKAEQEEKKQQLKARLLKIRLAAVGMPSGFGKHPINKPDNKPPYPDKHRSQRVDKVFSFVEKTKGTVKGKNIVPESKALEKFINTGEKVNPKNEPGGNKINSVLKKKLAKITRGNTAYESQTPEDIIDIDDIEQNIKPILGTGDRPNRSRKRRNTDRKFVNKNLRVSKEHGHTIIFKGHTRGLYRSASLEQQQGKFAKYWLLNAKQMNGNGWGISTKNASQNMRKFIGRPLVITSAKWHGASIYGDKFDHPYVPTNDLNVIFAHQEQFRVGNIVDILEKDGDFHAIIEMLPKFANMTLPPFCSPAIYQLDASEAEGNISKWEALHLAALDENPAYGARIALLKGTCVGTPNACSIQFKVAKQKEATITCPTKLKKKLARFKTAIAVRGFDKSTSYTRATEIFKVNGPMETKREGVDKNKEVEQLSRYIDTGRKVKPIGSDAEINTKLKERLANLTKGYGNTNPTKKKKKIETLKARLARTNAIDFLRKQGRSVDGSHHQSIFLTQKGEFVGGGEDRNISHIQQIDKILGTKTEPGKGDDIMDNFLQENGLIRVQRFPINRAGVTKTSVDARGMVSRAQIKAVQDIEKGGQEIGFATGDLTDPAIGEGSRDFIKSLRSQEMLG